MSGWTVPGTGDVNSDGKADIIWYNSMTGQVVIWLMDGASVIGGGSPGSAAVAWSAIGTGDFNGDGKTDILWINQSTGQVVIWLLNGTTVNRRWLAWFSGQPLVHPGNRRLQWRRDERHPLAELPHRAGCDVVHERRERHRRWFVGPGLGLGGSRLACRLMRSCSKR
jgi:hypothetical protein